MADSEDIAPLLRQLGELQRKNDSLEHRVRDLAPMSIGNTGTSLELRLRYAPDFLGSMPHPDRHLAFELESARRALLKAIRFKPSGQLLAGTMQPLASQAEADVLAERQKQREKWSYAHDDEHGDGEFVRVVRELLGASFDRDHIPYDEWELLRKHPEHRDRLVIAAALLIAELDRLDRAALRTPPSSPLTP